MHSLDAHQHQNDNQDIDKFQEYNRVHDDAIITQNIEMVIIQSPSENEMDQENTVEFESCTNDKLFT